MHWPCLDFNELMSTPKTLLKNTAPNDPAFMRLGHKVYPKKDTGLDRQITSTHEWPVRASISMEEMHR